MLIKVTIPSIYKNKEGEQINLPERLAYCAPDMAVAIKKAQQAIEEKGGKLILSDLFRSWDMQQQAYMDYVTKKKMAYSPPPGGSMHEAGRAMDIDLNAINMSLADLWRILIPIGFSPIISEPLISASEAWHFDYRGSHQKVYDYYLSIPKEKRNMKPYEAMAMSAILDNIEIPFTRKIGNINILRCQCMLIRLNKNIGLIDSFALTNTNKALEELVGSNYKNILYSIEVLKNKIMLTYPNEYQI